MSFKNIEAVLNEWDQGSAYEKMNSSERDRHCWIKGIVAECKARRDVLREALQIIQTWAACDHLDTRTREEAMKQIENQCKLALGGRRD